MNLPNMLSLFRLILVPVFVLVFFSGESPLWALGIYVVASATDVLDGCIARRYHLVTKLGRILDPLADKMMGATVLICICIRGIVPWWAAAIFVIKELSMMCGGLFLYRKHQDVPPSNILGKAATASFFAVCVLLLLFPGISSLAASMMIGVALGLSVLAMVVYAICYIRPAFRESRQDPMEK